MLVVQHFEGVAAHHPNYLTNILRREAEGAQRISCCFSLYLTFHFPLYLLVPMMR